MTDIILLGVRSVQVEKGSQFFLSGGLQTHTMRFKNALISGFIFGVLTGLLFLLTGWIPFFGMVINALILACALLFAFFGGFGVAYLDRRSGEVAGSHAPSGALFGLVFSLVALVSAFIAFLTRSIIGSAVTVGLSGGIALPLAVVDLVGNGIAVALCGLLSVAVIIALGAAGGFVGGLALKEKK